MNNGHHRPHDGHFGSARLPSAPPPSPTRAAAGPPLSLHEIYRGRKVFILGATGFVGKVLLAMLLDRFPQLGRAYVMVRRGSGTSSEDRFWNNVVPSPVFNPLRDKYGGAEGLRAWLADKVRVVDGDITEPNLGMSEEAAQAVAQDIDVVINSSGKVTFNPPLESALRTNVQGTKNVIAFVKRMKRPAVLHTSTCFVAGNRSGEVWESEELVGYFPRRKELPATRFTVEQEIADSDRMAAEVRAQADDAQVVAMLRERARDRLKEQGRDPDDEGSMKLSLARERKDWVRQELTDRGVKRAADWGWPNIYTYTKSMGDQLVARETDIVRTIVRPAIV
jgi:long-chain acyl-CoA synthetase